MQIRDKNDNSTWARDDIVYTRLTNTILANANQINAAMLDDKLDPTMRSSMSNLLTQVVKYNNKTDQATYTTRNNIAKIIEKFSPFISDTNLQLIFQANQQKLLQGKTIESISVN